MDRGMSCAAMAAVLACAASAFATEYYVDDAKGDDAVAGNGAPMAPLPVAPAPFECSGEARQPVKMVVSDFVYKGGHHKGVRFVAGGKSVLVSGVDEKVDVNRRIGFGRVVIYSGAEPLASLFLQKGWSLEVGDRDEPEIDAEKGRATWRKSWQDKGGKEHVCSYTLSGDDKGCVFVDYDFGVTEDEARALGSVPFISSVGLPGGRCHDRVYGMGTTPHIAQDPAMLAAKGPPNYQNAVPVEDKSDVFFYEPDNEARHFTITLPEGLGRTAQWYEGLESVGTQGERQNLHLRYFNFGDFVRAGSAVRTKGRFVIDLCKSSAPLHKGEPAYNGVDFWANDARHVPIPPTRNLLRNGSFEQNWKDWRWSYGGGWTERVAPGEERFAILEGGMGGGRALRIRPTQKRVWAVVSTSVPTILGRKYTLSWYARSDNPNGNVVVMQCSAGRDGTPRGHYSHVREEPPVKLGTEWKRYSTTFKGTAAGVFVQVNGNDAWVDRIMLEESDVMTDYVEDPVLARLVTSNPDNDLRPGQPINARLELSGLKPVSGRMRVVVKNYYSEILYKERFAFSIPKTVRLALDPAKLGTGVFVVRMDFDAAGRRWTDYCRFCIADPLDNTHPTATFFCEGAAPWFSRIDRCVDVARKAKEWGFGSVGPQAFGNAYAKDPSISSLCRENNIRLMLHAVINELSTKEYLRCHHPGPEDLTDARLAELEAVAYKAAKECAPDDTLWAWNNEEDQFGKRHGFDTHFKFVMAAYRGCKRAFDERGLKLRFAPTHGVSHYFRGRNYDLVDSYLETAKKHGFMYDAVAIHSYSNIDGSILGEHDAEVETQHLVDRMKFYGYPDDTPILLSECFNMIPWHVPEWGAVGWGDFCWCGPPSEDFGQREFVHAGAMARLYLLALKFYPKVTFVNTWMWCNYAFVDHDLQPFAWLKMVNTLGHLFPDPRYYGGARPYPDVRGHVFIQDDKAILAVWTTNNDVERGTRKGPVLTMKLPADAKFVDLMGNERRGDGSAVPLTPAPLFIVSAKKNAAALVNAVKTAETDDPSQAIETEIRPMLDGAIELEISNATSVPQKVNIGEEKTATLAGGATRKGRIAPPKDVKPMEMYSFATNYPFLSRPWKMSYFYIPKCGAEPDWSNIPSLPIANEVRRSPERPVTMKASFKTAWNENRLFLRVEVEDDVPIRHEAFGNVLRNQLFRLDECLEVYFDAFADGRKVSFDEFDENDSRYDFAGGRVWRLLAVNWQLAQGTASATDEEVMERLEQKWIPTEKGCIYEIAFAPRYLAPIELKPGTRASLGLYIHDRDAVGDKGENGLSNATERGKVCNKQPRFWPEFILMPQEVPPLVKGDAGWMRGKVGIMVHWLYPTYGDTQRWEAGFDTKAFLADFERTGAEWLIFTAGQCKGVYCSPSERLEAYCGPGHSTRRDILSEVAHGVKALGRRFIVYSASEMRKDGCYDSSMQRGLCWYTNSTDRTEFQRRWTEVLAEWARRLGSNIDGWWLDGAGTVFHPRGIDASLWAKALRAGNQKAVWAFNMGVDDGSWPFGSHYTAGEVAEFRKISPEGVKPMPPPGVVRHTLFPIDGYWGAWWKWPTWTSASFQKARPELFDAEYMSRLYEKREFPTPICTEDELRACIERATGRGEAVTVNIGISPEGRLNPKSCDLLRNVINSL